MRRGYLVNATVLLLLIPLLLLASTYQQTYGYIVHSQSQRALVERQYFSVESIRGDLQNVVELSFKRAYISLTEYVITYDFVDNASSALVGLMETGTVNGVAMSSMGGITLYNWYSNVTSYLNSVGFKIIPSTPNEFLSNHLDILVAPLDSFHVVVRVRIKDITVEDSSGLVVYSGNIPQRGYVYSVVSIEGFEDPFIVRKLNGLYTRVITPCRIPFPGTLYGYYNISDPNDVSNLAMDWCYVGLPDNESAGVYYPTIFERFEGVMRPEVHAYYVNLAEELQRELGYTSTLPVGLETFMISDPEIDPMLFGALDALDVSPGDSTAVSYYFLRYAVDGSPYLQGQPLSSYVQPPSDSERLYDSFRLDPATEKLLFGG